MCLVALLTVCPFKAFLTQPDGLGRPVNGPLKRICIIKGPNREPRPAGVGFERTVGGIANVYYFITHIFNIMGKEPLKMLNAS